MAEDEINAGQNEIQLAIRDSSRIFKEPGAVDRSHLGCHGY